MGCSPLFFLIFSITYLPINRQTILLSYESGAAFELGLALDVRTAWENG
jgi:hypothetical protein